MRTVQTLIDECVNTCGSQSALARRLGIEPNDVNTMVRGKRPISPATVGLLCDVLQIEGDEALKLAAEAIINNAKGEKQGVLRRVFLRGKAIGAVSGAVAMMLIGGQAMTDAVHRIGIIDSTMYIM